jgi:hypothetical protein
VDVVEHVLRLHHTARILDLCGGQGHSLETRPPAIDTSRCWITIFAIGCREAAN